MGALSGGAGRFFVGGNDAVFIYSSDVQGATAPDSTVLVNAIGGLSALAQNQVATATTATTAESDVYNPNDGKYTVADQLTVQINAASTASNHVLKVYVDGVLVHTHTIASLPSGLSHLTLKLGGMAYKNLKITVSVSSGAGSRTTKIFGQLARLAYK